MLLTESIFARTIGSRFRTEGATHSTTCSESSASVTSGLTGSGGSGSCPYTKDSVSWAEYQVTIPMTSGTGDAAFLVIMEFDADTTIVSAYISINTLSYLLFIAGKLSQQLSVHAHVCWLALHRALPLHLSPAADVQREEDQRCRGE